MNSEYPLRFNTIEHQGKFYLYDLVSCEVVEAERFVHDVIQYLQRHPDADAHEIQNVTEQAQSTIEDLLQRLGKRQPAKTPEAEYSDKLKLLVYARPDVDVSSAAGGHTVLWHTLVKHLRDWAEITYLSFGTSCGTDSVCFDPMNPATYLRICQEEFDAVLIDNLVPTRGENPKTLMPLVRYLNCPVIALVSCLRGSNGDVINGVLSWYSLMRDFDRLVVPSQAVMQFYSDLVQDKSLFAYIPYGVDAALFRPMEKTAAKGAVARILDDRRVETHPVVGFLSRFQPEKGAGYFLSVARQNPEFIFLVVAPTLSTYAFRDLPSNIVFAGPQQRSQLPLFINAFDVHCFPSVVGEESFGLAPLEAMACGVPVVAGRFSGLPEVVGDGGILVECETFRDEVGSVAGYIRPDALSSAIRRLLVCPAERDLLAKNALRQSKRFGWDRSAKDLVELIRHQRAEQKMTNRVGDRVPPVLFSAYDPVDGSKRRGRSHLLSVVGALNEHSLMWHAYTQSVEDGLVLSLIRSHSVREVEAVARWLFPDRAQDTIARVRQFLHTIS